VSYTRLSLMLGSLALAGLCVLAGIGFTAAIPVLVTVAVLVLLVAAGNLLSGRPPKPRGETPVEPTQTDPAEQTRFERAP